MDKKELLKQLTLEEKAELCTGDDFWHTKAVERLGIPAVMMSDGPSGLRKQDEASDHLGINESIQAVCFPASAAVAASFDVQLAYKLGETLGEECQAEHLALLLGPGLNIKRSPLCGRNFEYFSEDPALAGQMGAALVKGLQSAGAGSCVKHYAANNQETDRMVSDSRVEERTLHEIYLPAFETVVKQAKPWAVMCAYNKLNGVYCSENKELLTDILRTRWGYRGLVMTDWGAVKNRATGVWAGLDLEMPGGSRKGIRQVIDAVNAGTLSMEDLDKAVENVLELVEKYLNGRKTGKIFDREADYQKARAVAEQCAVLLKNNGALPLEEHADVVLIGDFARKPRYQGGGSSHVNSTRVSTPLEAMPAGMAWVQGYDQAVDEPDETLQAQAVEAARKAKAAVILAGLPDRCETEGADRETLDIPENQNALIEAVAAVQPNTVVVLYNGAPVTMPWLADVNAVLEMYLAGDGVGEATMNLLYGKVNPSGKLAETFPLKLADTPSYLNFPGEEQATEYHEGIFVGYRYYDKKEMDVLFPFGHGLSYTTFAYSGLTLDKKRMKDTDNLTVRFTVTNTGNRAGAEAAQLYVCPPSGRRMRPVKELKSFAKVQLAPGESKTVELTLAGRDFAYYEPLVHGFHAESGVYGIAVGASSRDLRLMDGVAVECTSPLPVQYSEYSSIGSVMATEAGSKLLGPALHAMNSANSTLGDSDGEGISRIFASMLVGQLVSFGMMTEEQLQNLLKELNG